MPATWDLIASASPSGTAAGTWSNIPQTYTDLVIITNARVTTAWDIMAFQLNQSTGPYDQIYWEGTGQTSGTGTAQISARGNYIPGTDYSGAYDSSVYYLSNYSNSSTFKTLLTRGGGAFNRTFSTMFQVTTWQSTSSVTSIVYGTANGGNFASGSYLKLYGVKAA